MTLPEIKKVMSETSKGISVSQLDEVNQELEHLEKKLESLKSAIKHASPEEKCHIAKELQYKMVPVMQMISTLLS